VTSPWTALCRSACPASLPRGGRQARAVEQGDRVPARQQGAGDIERDEAGAAED